MQYAGMRRSAKPRKVRRKFVDGQKKIVRFVLMFIVLILLIIFVFGDHLPGLTNVFNDIKSFNEKNYWNRYQTPLRLSLIHI